MGDDKSGMTGLFSEKWIVREIFHPSTIGAVVKRDQSVTVPI